MLQRVCATELRAEHCFSTPLLDLQQQHIQHQPCANALLGFVSAGITDQQLPKLVPATMACIAHLRTANLLCGLYIA